MTNVDGPRLAGLTGGHLRFSDHIDNRLPAAFLSGAAHPALEAVAAQFRESGLAPEVLQNDSRIELNVPHGDRGQFRYTIRARSFRAPSFAWTESDGRAGGSRHYRAMATGAEGEQQHDVTGYTRDQLINDLLKRYTQFRHARRLP